MADSRRVSEECIKLEAEANALREKIRKIKAETEEVRKETRKIEAESLELQDLLIKGTNEIGRLQAEIAYTRFNFRKTLDETERDLVSGKLSASQIEFIQRETDRLQLSVEWNEPALDQKIEQFQRILNEVKPPKAQ